MKALKILSKQMFALFLLIVTNNCYSQITTIAVPKEKEKEVLKYDSLESINYENAPLHVGQTLFLKGNSYSKTNGFCYCFFIEKFPDRTIDTRKYLFKPVKKIEEIKKIEDKVSDFSSLAGKYYKVMSIESEMPLVGDSIFWVKLDDNNNTTFYLRIENGFTTFNYFVTLGYYEKMKQTFVGKDFYTTGRYELEKIDVKEKIILPYKVKFRCTDIAVNVGEDGPIFAVLENEKYGRIKGVIIKGKKLDNFITVSYYNDCIKKYGAKFGSDVAEGKVEIGMNKNMVRDAWGSPDNVNVTEGSFGRHEQWVYKDRYLYFQNGKLTSMQL